jgi:hypothetical protein
MTVAEIIRDAQAAAGVLPIVQQQPSVAERIRRIWPVCVVGFGLVATVAWMALLGWALYRAVLLLA